MLRPSAKIYPVKLYNNKMYLHPAVRRRLIKWAIIFLVLAAVVAGAVWWADNHYLAKPEQIGSAGTVSSPVKAPTSQAGFNKQQYSINDPTSFWAVVNKGRVLPTNYVPTDLVIPNLAVRPSATSDEKHLRQIAANALGNLFDGAKTAGYSLMIASAYRSYATQVSVYNNFVASQGQASADQSSARPGHSEHQTGLAIDIEPASRSCEIEQCFGGLPEGKWLAANAYKYGFIIRYQKDKQNLTGYEYEPWHIRYLGSDLAAELNKSGQTLEQFFGLPTYPDYPATTYQLKTGN